MPSPYSFLVTALALAALLGLGIAAIRFVSSWNREAHQSGPESGRGDWENALAGYKNLRDQGVLSEEEYRKIRTLVEPHVQQSATGGTIPPAGPAPHPRDDD